MESDQTENSHDAMLVDASYRIVLSRRKSYRLSQISNNEDPSHCHT
jgi:hypothetical protein